ncbi:MAG: PilZ domain-containing protein [Methylovulum sp.]|uniref:PilZ domain-containing protein n=1 Tax=Methylovulum sp. TaxID=1916980 RepID=UPI00261F1131|nr:PilZ domain-containing protein [Methylovulum sp.]MDD2723054.1 PilZ domain-containing protein [Methylovulum sp.]MDD5123757.1 PilZ domain-containing protein [Methylovulum sp.]
MLEKRKHPRVPTDLDFSFFLDGQQYTGKVGNISLSGAFLSAPEPELIPSYIAKSGDLTIQLNDELLVLKSEVVYAVGHDNAFFPVGAGLIFSKTDEETRLSIMKLATLEL